MKFSIFARIKEIFGIILDRSDRKNLFDRIIFCHDSVFGMIFKMGMDGCAS